MAKHKTKNRQARTIWLLFAGIIVFGAVLAMMLRSVDVALFNPKGLIAEKQLNLILFTSALLLTIAVPTLMLLYAFAWHYRDTNTKAAFNPHAQHGKLFVFSIWTIPALFMIVLALVMMPATHRLEPKKQIAASSKPLTIRVIAMRWKWLFIYPEQNIATVNHVQIPVDRPVEFELTADETPMSSFWIPHLGGQLYAMTGHVTRLNLIADTAGDYPGSTAEINGRGFASMKFTARASSQEDFDKWAQAVKQSSNPLDANEYEKLLKPSEDTPASFYSHAEPDLYDKLLMKYNGSHTQHTEAH